MLFLEVENSDIIYVLQDGQATVVASDFHWRFGLHFTAMFSEWQLPS